MRHLRAIVRAVGLIAVTLATYFALILRLPFVGAYKGPANQWRGFIACKCARAAAAILGINIAASGSPPALPFLLVSNHLSYVDVVVFGSLLDCVFVARGDAARWPVIGPLCRAAGSIFVDREKRKDVARVNCLIEQALRDGRGVVLFAEGTSTPGDIVLPFKSSLLEQAARASFPVSYASITYRTREGDEPAHMSVCWWGDMTFFKHLIGLLYVKKVDATVVFGSQTIQAGNRKVLAERLWASVTDLFIPVVDSSEMDVQIASVKPALLANKMRIVR